ncbi:MAG TPA: ATP-binding protein [Anaerolineaceae bacterium]|nr:ATP-binding protein [Anaerolineaceae bacterium]HPN53876.1 ATP-binding protein [Anaerolineaceae bacterium]
MTDYLSFVGRTEELKLLDDLYASGKAEFLVLYGRRRVGKTRLLTEWLNTRKIKPIFFVAEQDSRDSLLRQFSQIIYRKAFPNLPVPETFTFASWEQAWNQIGDLAQRERLVVFIDEFTYMMASDPTLASNLQRLWDSTLEKTSLFLCISGSHLGMMVRGVLSGTAPLYGRTTAKMELKMLPFGSTKSYFPHYSASDRVMLYSVFGGIPHYWRLIDQKKSVLENIKRLLLSPGGNLKDEPRILLNDYISDPNNYIAILRAIANGYATPKEIESTTGIPNVHLSQYLANLANTGYVIKKMPVTAAPSSRSGRYMITDPFLRFYYRFIHSRLTQLEMGEIDQTIEELQKHMVDYIGTHTWEEICREWTLRASNRNFLPLYPDYVESDWGKEHQVDVAGINTMKKHLILGECKWLKERGRAAVLQELVEKKAGLVVPGSGQWRVFFLGFSREGWNESAEEYARNISQAQPGGTNWQNVGMRLMSLEDVDKDLQDWASAKKDTGSL